MMPEIPVSLRGRSELATQAARLFFTTGLLPTWSFFRLEFGRSPSARRFHLQWATST